MADAYKNSLESGVGSLESTNSKIMNDQNGLCDIGAEDLGEILPFWEKCGLWPHEAEDIELMARALEKNKEFAVGWRVKGELVGTTVGIFDGFRGNLWRVGVHPDYQRQGIASKLITEVEKRLVSAGAKQINVMVYIANLGAQAFYERLGYESSPAKVVRKRF